MSGLEHVTLIGTSPMALVASARSKYMKFTDVNSDARSVKGVTIGSIGTGSLGHLAMIQAGKQDGWSWTHVPYRGGGPLMNDVVAGHTPLGIGTVFLVMPHVKAGTVRPIAVTVERINSELQKALKDPSVAERLAAQGMTITGQGPAEFKAFTQKEIERWRKVVKDNGISAGS